MWRSGKASHTLSYVPSALAVAERDTPHPFRLPAREVPQIQSLTGPGAREPDDRREISRHRSAAAFACHPRAPLAAARARQGAAEALFGCVWLRTPGRKAPSGCRASQPRSTAHSGEHTKTAARPARPSSRCSCRTAVPDRYCSTHVAVGPRVNLHHVPRDGSPSREPFAVICTLQAAARHLLSERTHRRGQ
jgi:hypothetical protein